MTAAHSPQSRADMGPSTSALAKYAAGTGTVEAKAPMEQCEVRTLGNFCECGEGKEQSTPLGKDSVKTFSNVLMASQRRRTDSQTSVRPTGGISNPNLAGPGADRRWGCTHGFFACVQADTGLCKQVMLQAGIEMCNPG